MHTLSPPVLSLTEAAKELLSGALAARLSFPGLTVRSNRIMAEMQSAVGFLRELRPERQDRYMVLRPPFDRPEDCDDGWIVRRGSQDGRSLLRDDKMYFHCRRLFRRWVEGQHSLDTSWFRSLLFETEVLRTEALRVSLGLARAFDVALGERSRAADALFAERDELVVRVLQYLGAGKEGRLGNLHWDKSFFTLQLGQSIDGLVLLDPATEEPFAIESEPDTAVVFFGKQSRHMLGELVPSIEPIRHYIQDVRGPGDDQMRNGIVSFAHVLPPNEVRDIRGDTPV